MKWQFGLSGLRVRAVLATVLIMPALLMGTAACGGDQTPRPPQVIVIRARRSAICSCLKLTASVKDGAGGVRRSAGDGAGPGAYSERSA